MKKIYLFIVSTLFLGIISASAQRVILRVNNNYEVNIDGRYYEYNETVPALNYGTHTVKLYEVRPGFVGIGKKRTLVSSANFELRNNDVIIETDSYGQLRIYEEGYNTRRQETIDRNGEPVDRDYDRNDEYKTKNGKGYGPYNNPGRGHKYGLYKKDHDKKAKGKKNKPGK
jgi:hypothetical protein